MNRNAVWSIAEGQTLNIDGQQLAFSVDPLDASIVHLLVTRVDGSQVDHAFGHNGALLSTTEVTPPPTSGRPLEPAKKK